MISSWPYFSDDEIELASNVMKSGLVNTWTGSITRSFEKEFAEYFDLENALTTANGTLALEAAYDCLDIKSGDEIITTPRTFIATASAAVLKGARVVFADVDKNSGCITPESIEPLINSKTKAIAVVHIGGWPADIKNIYSLADFSNVKLIEDCSQAHGAKFGKKYVGSFSDIATWSFCNDKIISTGGEGGMISTKNSEYYSRIWSYRDHGKEKKLVENIKDKNSFKWLHSNFGKNIRMTEIQSAIGSSQLSKLDLWIEKRTFNAFVFISYLSKISCIRIPVPDKNLKPAWYKFYFYVIPKALKSDWTRERIINEINNAGYPAFTGSCGEIYLEKCFKDLGLMPEKRLKVARELGETSIMLLVHPTITNKEIHEYATQVKGILKLAQR